MEGDRLRAAMSRATARDPWLVAMRAFEKCREAERAFDKEVWEPAVGAAAVAADRIDGSIDAEMEKLADARRDAEDALIMTAAPNLWAAVWKIDHAEWRWSAFEGWPDHWQRAIFNDLRRLAGRPQKQ